MADKTSAIEPDAGKQIQPRLHDAGSRANETVDGLDSLTEALRQAAEETPSSALPEKIENVPVFERAGLAHKI